MGRAKSDVPENFPWDKYFSFDNDIYLDAVEKCNSTNTNAEIVRKALRALEVKVIGGDKETNCNKINKEISMIKKKLSKIEDNKLREDTTLKVKEYFKSRFLNSVYPDKKIVTPEKPFLPKLTDSEISEINDRFPTIINESASSKSTSRSSSPAPTLKSSQKTSSFSFESSGNNEDKVLEACMIVYYNTAPIENNKIKLSKDGALMFVKKVFQNKIIDPKSKLINEADIVKVLQKLVAQIKETKVTSIPSDVVISAKTVIKQALEALPSSTDSEEYKKPPTPAIKPVSVTEVSPVLPASKKPSKYTKQDFINVIKSKGWEVPSDDSSENLCDYILEQIEKEKGKYTEYEKQLNQKAIDLETKLENTLLKLESKVAEFEQLQSLRQDDLKSITETKTLLDKKEKEIKSLEKKIDKLEKELIDIQQKQESVVSVQEEQRQVCFAMNQWLDQDSFNVSDAEDSMSCKDSKYPVCNIDQQRCTDSREEFSLDDEKFKITSSNKNKINNIKNKIDYQRNPPIQPVVEPTPVQPVVEPTPAPAKKKLTKDDLVLVTRKVLEETRPKEINNEVIDLIISTFSKEYKVSKDKISSYKTNFINIANELIKEIKPIEEPQPVEEIKEPTNDEIYEQIKEIVLDDEDTQSMRGNIDAGVDAIIEYLQQLFKVDFTSKRQTIIDMLIDAVRNKVLETTVKDKIIEFVINNNIRKAKSSNISSLLNFLFEEYNIDFNQNKDEIVDYFKQVIEEHKKPSSLQKCSTKDSYSSYDEAVQDLQCPDGEVCDLVKGVCRIAEEDDTVEEININDVIVKVIGSENIINTLKEKIKSSQVVETEPEPLVEIKKEEPIIEVEKEEPLIEVEEEPIIEEEKVVEPSLPTVQVETPKLEDIIKGIKEITTEKKVATTTQQKLKVAQQKAIQRLRECAGLK